MHPIVWELSYFGDPNRTAVHFQVARHARGEGLLPHCQLCLKSKDRAVRVPYHYGLLDPKGTLIYP